MRRLLLGLAMLGLLAPSLVAQDAAVCPGMRGLQATGEFESLTVSSTALGFTAARITPESGQDATVAVLTLETNSIRYRVDGIAPTATVGHLLTAGSQLIVCGRSAVLQTRLIRQSADGTAMITYYREGTR